MDVTMTRPDGSTDILALEQSRDGSFQKSVEADQLGIYSFEDSEGQKRFAAVGELNPLEISNLITSPEPLAPLVRASGGGTLWLSETKEPNVRTVSARKRYAGRNWVALRKNNGYTVSGIQNRPLLPAWMAALLILACVTIGWWREGQIK